jgi:hypothetical protein
MRLYTHSPLGQEIRAAAGHYVIEAEKRLPFRGREVLVATGYVTVDSSCCGAGGCGFALVPGYLVGWKSSKSETGEPTSEVEPIGDEAERVALRKSIQEAEKVQQVNFW